MPAKRVYIDDMAVEDLERVYEIEKTSFPDPWPYSIFLNDLKSDDMITIVARQNRTVVGFAICQQILDELHLMNIAVDPEFRRKKIGHALIEHLFYIGDEKRCRIMYLDVRESNSAAISFYKGYGFKVLYERKGYYRKPPESALVMVLDLKERSKSGVV